MIFIMYSQPCPLDVSTQATCTESAVQNPTYDSRWHLAGLDTNLDFYLKCGKIITFKLEWFPIGSEKWSDWYVVGVNDIDHKVNEFSFSSCPLRRMWSYFSDHCHKYIICTQNTYQSCACKSKTIPGMRMQSRRSPGL